MSGNSSRLGVWMPKQKDGKNWEVDFSVIGLCDGELRTGTKKFRVRANALKWIAGVKHESIESNEVKEPLFKNFKHSKPRKIEGEL